jgi:hypothetical protein
LLGFLEFGLSGLDGEICDERLDHRVAQVLG